MDVRARKAAGRSKTRSRRSPGVMMWARRLHLYIGVLFAPTLLFYSVTGMIQVYGLHKANPATGYEPAPLLIRLGALHKDQTFALLRKDEVRLVQTAVHHGHKRDDATESAAIQPAAPPEPKPLNPGRLLLKAFSAAAAAALSVMTLLGLYVAYAMGRDRWLATGLLAAGVLIPLGLIAGFGA